MHRSRSNRSDDYCATYNERHIREDRESHVLKSTAIKFNQLQWVRCFNQMDRTRWALGHSTSAIREPLAATGSIYVVDATWLNTIICSAHDIWCSEWTLLLLLNNVNKLSPSPMFYIVRIIWCQTFCAHRANNLCQKNLHLPQHRWGKIKPSICHWLQHRVCSALDTLADPSLATKNLHVSECVTVLGTTIFRIQSISGSYVGPVKAMCDSGPQVNLITEECV